MTPAEAIRICLSAHFYLWSDKRFWYDKALQEASKLLYVAASDLRVQNSTK